MTLVGPDLVLGVFNCDVGNLLRTIALDLGILLLGGAVVGRVGVVTEVFTLDPGVLEPDLDPGLWKESIQLVHIKLICNIVEPL